MTGPGVIKGRPVEKVDIKQCERYNQFVITYFTGELKG